MLVISILSVVILRRGVALGKLSWKRFLGVINVDVVSGGSKGVVSRSDMVEYERSEMYSVIVYFGRKKQVRGNECCVRTRR
jgi:hypothetical protein